MTWRPMKVPTRTWREYIDIFRSREAENPAFAPLRRLCEHVERSAYRDLLFCASSMAALLVSQHREIEWGCNMLRIELDTSGAFLWFSLHEQTFVKPKPFRCEAEGIIETFESFLRKTKWVTEAVLDERAR